MNRLRKLFQKIPTITTPRLILRKMLQSDAEDMYEYASQECVTKYLLWSPHKSLAFTRQYLEQLQSDYRDGEFFDWAVTMRDTKKMIGTCGFTSIESCHGRAEIGYVLNPAYWSKGIASEAVSAVLDYGFKELKLNRIEAHYMDGNVRSRRVMEKCGMTYEGMHRDYMYIKDEYRDIGVCAILASEYYESRASGNGIGSLLHI